MARLWTAIAVGLLAAGVLGSPAPADDGPWRGTLTTEKEVTCEFSELDTRINLP